jgi:hypothetical protein
MSGDPIRHSRPFPVQGDGTGLMIESGFRRHPLDEFDATGQPPAKMSKLFTDHLQVQMKNRQVGFRVKVQEFVGLP